MASVLGLGASKQPRSIHEFPESIREAHDLLQGQSFQDTQFSNNHHHVLQKEDNFGQQKVLTEKNAVGPSQWINKLIDFAQVNNNVAETHEKSPTSSSSRTFQGTLMSTNVSSEIQDVSMNQKFLDASTSKADDWNVNLVRLEETKVQ
uniref:Uncharacterized protein n=1 Tax=Ananas comosus var. bracteatus TaxID=296719 RepID=A0A6V7Q9R4_ANACO|nr:unnamed protein product [Ananas comosus var. bracteatus]